MGKNRELDKLMESPELSEYRDRLRKALESAPDGMTDQEVISYANAAEMEFLRGVIRLCFPSSEDWHNMDLQQRATFRAGNLHLNEIAERFGIFGNVMGSDAAFKELGRMIYSDDSEPSGN